MPRLLATPTVGFLFGCYLYISVNWWVGLQRWLAVRRLREAPAGCAPTGHHLLRPGYARPLGFPVTSMP